MKKQAWIGLLTGHMTFHKFGNHFIGSFTKMAIWCMILWWKIQEIWLICILVLVIQLVDFVIKMATQLKQINCKNITVLLHIKCIYVFLQGVLISVKAHINIRYHICENKSLGASTDQTDTHPDHCPEIGRKPTTTLSSAHCGVWRETFHLGFQAAWMTLEYRTNSRSLVFTHFSRH